MNKILKRVLSIRVLPGLVLALGGTMVLGFAAKVAVAEPLQHKAPIWYADDRQSIPEPHEREPSLLWDGPSESFKRAGGRLIDPERLVRRVGTVFGGDHVPAAENINSLDEAPNSSWFTNRLGLFPMSVEEIAIGPGTGLGPSTTGKWVITRAKTEGVTPGFNIKDANGDNFLIKFDPLESPNIASAAGVISGLLLHAAGYSVPDDAVVYFTRDQLELGSDVKISMPDGSKRKMTEADIEEILARVPRSANGSFRAVSSRFLSGKPLGPFDYKGRRKDDPNDRIAHQNRRELRGLRIFAAWIKHFDTKQHNSLDMYVTENGRSYVKHHLIDFASTLGTGAHGPSPIQGMEQSVDFPAILGRTLALGFHEDAWRKLERPKGLSEVGYFTSEHFDPLEFKPLVPNSAFANMTGRDAYWAAKIISAFTDEQLLAIAEKGRYENPKAAPYMAKVLGERRDIIAKKFFDEIPPLDFFRVEGTTMTFQDLGTERGIYPSADTRYRYRVGTVNANRGEAEFTPWEETSSKTMDLNAAPGSSPDRFWVAEVQVHRGEGWSSTVTSYASPRINQVVAIDR